MLVPQHGIASRAHSLLGRYQVQVLLLTACLVPRLWVASLQQTVCPDAVEYLETVQLLQSGDYAQGLEYLNLNIYPAILLALRQLAGQWWIVAAGTWSLAMSVLAVLPLYGLIRQQLGRQAAILAGLLYALHPRLVLHSPLVMRDPTFWFLFLLALYLSWQAAVRPSMLRLTAAGVTILLAVHTRIEGVLLLVPLGVWNWRLVWPSPVWRKRFLWGAAAVLALAAGGSVLMNLTFLRSHERWEAVGLRHAEDLWHRVLAPLVLGRGAAGVARPAVHAASVEQIDFGLAFAPESKTNRRLVVRFVKTFTYLYGVLVLAGIWSLRRQWARIDILPYYIVAAVAFVGVWLKYNIAPIDQRYFFPILFVSFPGLSLGVVQWAEWIGRAASKVLADQAVARRASLVAVLAAVVLSGLIDGLRVGRPTLAAWHQQAELGCWIRQQFGAGRTITSNNEENRLVLYYAEGRMSWIADQYVASAAAAAAADRHTLPDVVVLWPQEHRPDAAAVAENILRVHRELGYRRVPDQRLPERCRRLTVLVQQRLSPGEDGDRSQDAPLRSSAVAERMPEFSSAGSQR